MVFKLNKLKLLLKTLTVFKCPKHADPLTTKTLFKISEFQTLEKNRSHCTSPIGPVDMILLSIDELSTVKKLIFDRFVTKFLETEELCNCEMERLAELVKNVLPWNIDPNQ